MPSPGSRKNENRTCSQDRTVSVMNNMATSSQTTFHELAFYTLAHPGTDFIHQHAVDAFTAQEATETTKPIALYFALAGLYLFLEKNYTGRQVQQAHVLFTRKTKDYPRFTLPEARGVMRVGDVLAGPPGPERDGLIKAWCRVVWDAFQKEHNQVISFTEMLLDS